MRILLVLGHSNPFAGAAWRRIEHFAQSWSSEGHEIHVLGTISLRTLHQRGSISNRGFQTCNVIPTINGRSIPTFILNVLSSFLSAFIVFMVRRPTVVVISVPPGSIGIGTICACILSRCSYVIDYRDEWDRVVMSGRKNGIGKSFELIVSHLAVLLYNRSKFVVAVTKSMSKYLKNKGVHEVFVIMNGADLDTFSPARESNSGSQYTLLYVGGIGDYYKIEVIMDALARLHHNGISKLRFLFAGAGEVERMMNYAKNLGISRVIEYLGVIQDKKELAHLIQTANFGLIPYDDNPLWKHTLPAKFFEYCACGIPILATAYEDSELAEVILENKIGLVTPPLDSNALADAISWLVDHPEEIENYGKNARNLVLKCFNRSTHSMNFLKLIEKSIAPRKETQLLI